MVENCAYLFLGEDEIEKKNKIEAIKERFLDKDFKGIDFEVVYADDKNLSPPKFSEVLSYLPSSPSRKRVVLIKNIESLKEGNRQVLFKYLKNNSESVILLLDTARIDRQDPFLKELAPYVKKIELKTTEKTNAFDLAKAVTSRNPTRALSILHRLLNNRGEPHAILGALLWQWDKTKDKLSLPNFKQGLKLLLDTDLRIKTGRLDGELALEMVVIRLSYLV
jgi:DNA polymerase III delta subunit